MRFYIAVTPAIPISIGIAILRYRLYDIDIIINRTLVYGSLTVTLVALYFGGVSALQSALRTLTGQSSPQLAVVASTLVIAALFNSLEAAHPVLHRSALLPQEVRREKDPRSLLGEAAGRDGPGGLERRSGGGGEGDDAARPRLAVAAVPQRSW